MKLLKRNTIYRGKVFTVIVDDIEYPSGNRSVREVAEHSGGAVALPVFPDNTILLVKQFRYPFQQYLLELPAGKLNQGEDPLQCAQRELEEETGFRANEWRKMTAIYTSPGFCSEVLHLFLATNLIATQQGQNLEEGEETLSVVKVSLNEAIRMIERGEIVDSKSICGILLGSRLLKG